MKILISLLIGLILGSLITLGLLQVVSPSFFEQTSEDYIAANYADNVLQLDLSECNNLPEEQLRLCVDGALLQKARMDRNESWCNDLVQVNLENQCKSSVSRLLAVDSLSTGGLCEGIDLPTCPDMAIVLSAQESGDAILCSKVSTPDLQAYCLTSVPGATTNAPSLTTSCDLGDSNCEDRVQVLLRAVQGQDEAICNALSDPQASNFCKAEVATYKAYLAGDINFCDAVVSDQLENCRLAVIVGRSLASGNNECSALENNLIDTCNTIFAQGVYNRFNFVQ